MEEEEQAIVVDWLELHKIKFSSIPNSTWTSSIKQKIKNKQQGLRGGLPDMIIIHNQKMLFIEMKRRLKSSSILRPKQREWIEAINTVPNCQAIVAYGATEAIAQIKNILQIRQ